MVLNLEGNERNVPQETWVVPEPAQLSHPQVPSVCLRAQSQGIVVEFLGEQKDPKFPFQMLVDVELSLPFHPGERSVISLTCKNKNQPLCSCEGLALRYPLECGY